jgi:glycosyltransferase involved in cell wall biosynthesis
VLILGGSYTSPTVANLLLRKRSGTMRIFWGERFRTESATLSALRGLLLSRTDVVLAVGDRAAAQYRRVTTRPVSVLPYACEAGAFGAKGHRERVGFVGQLIERKGVDTLLEACEMTGHREIDVVGSGPLEAGLRRDAQSRRLDVRWYGERRNAEVGAIRDAWAYQVVPSRYDGWGVVVNESLASGVPVVVSDGVGASELVRSGIDGWIHTAGSATSLASAMDSAHEARGQERLRTAARAVGVAFSAGPAASFVASVLNEPDVVRSFVQEQWSSLGDRFAGWPDRDDGVPQFAPGAEPPPS